MIIRHRNPDRHLVVVVTGSTGLIGEAIVRTLTARGCQVIGLDLHPPPPALAVDGADFRTVDVADEQAVRATATTLDAQYDGIDALVHAAALTGRSAELAEHSLRDVNLALWRRVLDVNLSGALICAREFGTRLRRGPNAQMILIGSIQGLVPTAGASSYAVSKAATVGLMRQLAAEFAEDGVRVNVVAPGPIADTHELEHLRAAEQLEQPTPMGRFGTPTEVAESIADLVLGSFGLLTGALLPLDGGEHLRPRSGPPRKHLLDEPRQGGSATHA